MHVLLCLVVALIAKFAVAQEDYSGPWRTSLDGPDACWTQSTTECSRALVIVHGGDWSLEAGIPYDSSEAFLRGYENGADMVKGDFRVCKDNIGMIMHSSPIEYFESLPCRGMKVEEMSVAECEACPMVSSSLSSFNFTSAPEMLQWSSDKVNFMFCMKVDTDIPRGISSMLEYSAQHRAVLEIKYDHLQEMYAQQPEGWQHVFYIAEITNTQQAQQLLAMPQELLQRAFLIEFQDYETGWSVDDLQHDLDAFKAAGCRTMAMTQRNSVEASLDNHRAIFAAGFDVVYSYNLANAVVVRREVNTARGISPA